MQPAPSASSLPASALCPAHTQPAEGTCQRCGTFYCTQCSVAGGVCPACLNRPVVLEGGQQPMYHAVSNAKLVVLSLCTFGLYPLVWFYRNWKLEKQRTGEDLSPFWRTFFTLFYFHDLIRRMNRHTLEVQAETVNVGNIVTAFVLLNLAARLPGPLRLVGLLSFLPLLRVQRLANAINAHYTPLAERNARFSAVNIVVIALGGLLLLLSIIGSFMPDTQ